jgi:hypothetical protein
MNLQHIQAFEKSFTCPVQWHRFENGPDVIVGERKSQFVTVQITLPVGALRDEIPGTAHVLEHAKMKGQFTEDGVHPKLLELSLEGVHGNAKTSHEFATYFLSGPVTCFGRMIETIASMAFESRFREAQIIRERGPIVQEYAQTERGKRFDFWRRERMIPESGFARSVIGTPETIRRVDLACLTDFNENGMAGIRLLSSSLVASKLKMFAMFCRRLFLDIQNRQIIRGCRQRSVVRFLVGIHMSVRTLRRRVWKSIFRIRSFGHRIRSYWAS